VRCSGRVRACACLENWVAAGAKLNHNRLLLAQYRNNGNTNLKLNLFPFVNVNCATAGGAGARESRGSSLPPRYIHRRSAANSFFTLKKSIILQLLRQKSIKSLN
jgi:hypothetical protein